MNHKEFFFYLMGIIDLHINSKNDLTVEDLISIKDQMEKVSEYQQIKQSDLEWLQNPKFTQPKLPVEEFKVWCGNSTEKSTTKPSTYGNEDYRYTHGYTNFDQ